ncbi:MAG: response regulator transcription factor, partial [Lachnospiraceae bacterium]|nr:response regulator transcription factor [Lachnospiraceae bacterium]
MKIVIVDDDKLVSLSLRTILEASGDISVCATGDNGNAAIDLYEEYKPDVMLLDIRMGSGSEDGGTEKNGLDSAEEILRRDPDAKILLLTTFQDDEYIIRAIRLGAKGYILKQDFESIAPALRAVFNGQTVFCDTVMDKLPGLIGTTASQSTAYFDYGLTEREFEIVRLIADGCSNKEISEELFLSEGTVRNYISVILEKLELRDRTQLAVF